MDDTNTKRLHRFDGFLFHVFLTLSIPFDSGPDWRRRQRQKRVEFFELSQVKNALLCIKIVNAIGHCWRVTFHMNDLMQPFFSLTWFSSFAEFEITHFFLAQKCFCSRFFFFFLALCFSRVWVFAWIFRSIAIQNLHLLAFVKWNRTSVSTHNSIFTKWIFICMIFTASVWVIEALQPNRLAFLTISLLHFFSFSKQEKVFFFFNFHFLSIFCPINRWQRWWWYHIRCQQYHSGSADGNEGKRNVVDIYAKRKYENEFENKIIWPDICTHSVSVSVFRQFKIIWFRFFLRFFVGHVNAGDALFSTCFFFLSSFHMYFCLYDLHFDCTLNSDVIIHRSSEFFWTDQKIEKKMFRHLCAKPWERKAPTKRQK